MYEKEDNMLKEKILSREAKIEVIGLGYIGLPTAALFANAGFNVVGIDVNKKIVDTVNRGEAHFIEPDLNDLVKNVVSLGKLKALTIPTEADIFLISVPTPIREDKKSDLSFVKSAAESILPVLKKDTLVILESTVPPGTVKDVLTPILSKSGLYIGKDIYVAHCPERVLPGKILKEAINNSRIVGGLNKTSTELAAELYNAFVKGEIVTTDSTTAEMCKLVENTYRDINIAFANELSILCDKLGISVWKLIEFANKHPRVNILKPGPGVGGHCIAVDPWFIVEKFPDSAKLIKMARQVNDSKPIWVIAKIEKLMESLNKKNPTIGIFGVTYKADVDDIRESPSLKIVHSLIKKGYNVKVSDPYVNPDNLDFPLYSSSDVINESDILVVLIPHKQFKTAEFKKKLLNSGKLLLDTVGMIGRI
jgi:UDP-N-acetyl-D-mannosaminuronic acid dehydrogenase